MPRFNLEDYETVETRLAKFWEDHPAGRVHTTLVESGERWVFRAEIYRDSDDPRAWATGYAEEITGSSPVNKTSAAENCETSAIGRALANAGYATKGKRPSREEMVKVASREDDTPQQQRPTQQEPQQQAAPAGDNPECAHGQMTFREGVSKKTNKPYSGYFCVSSDRDDQCPPIFGGAK